MQPSPPSSSRTFASPHTLGCLFLVFGCVLPGEQAPCLVTSGAHLHSRKQGCLTACCETKGGGCGPCFLGQVGCTREWLRFFPGWHRPAPQGHFLKAKVACNEYDNCGTIMTVRHEGEDAGQRGAGRPKNSLLWAIVASAVSLRRLGSPFFLHTGAHRGRFLVVPKAASSLSSTSGLPSPGPGGWVSSSRCTQRDGQCFPRALCSLSSVCASPPDHRPLEDRGAGFHSAIRSFTCSFTCVLCELLSVPGPVLAACVGSWSGERSEPGPDRVVQCWACRDRMVFPAPCARQRVGWERPAVQTCWGKCPSPTSSISLSVKQLPQKGVARSQGGGCTWQNKSTAAWRAWSRVSRDHGGVAPVGKRCSHVCPSVP